MDKFKRNLILFGRDEFTIPPEFILEWDFILFSFRISYSVSKKPICKHGPSRVQLFEPGPSAQHLEAKFRGKVKFHESANAHPEFSCFWRKKKLNKVKKRTHEYISNESEKVGFGSYSTVAGHCAIILTIPLHSLVVIVSCHQKSGRWRFPQNWHQFYTIDSLPVSAQSGVLIRRTLKPVATLYDDYGPTPPGVPLTPATSTR